MGVRRGLIVRPCAEANVPAWQSPRLAIQRLCFVGSVIVISAVLPCKHRVAAARFCDPDVRSWNTRRICALVIRCKPSGPPGNMRVKSVVIDRSNLTIQSVRTPETALGDTCPLDERRSKSSACLIMAGSTRAACSTVACPTCPVYASSRAPTLNRCTNRQKWQ